MSVCVCLWNQLDLIVDVVGSPTVDDLSSACETAKQHVLRRAPHQPDLTILYGLSNDCDHEVVHLLCQMLVFNPVSCSLVTCILWWIAVLQVLFFGAIWTSVKICLCALRIVFHGIGSALMICLIHVFAFVKDLAWSACVACYVANSVNWIEQSVQVNSWRMCFCIKDKRYLDVRNVARDIWIIWIQIQVWIYKFYLQIVSATWCHAFYILPNITTCLHIVGSITDSCSTTLIWLVVQLTINVISPITFGLPDLHYWT